MHTILKLENLSKRYSMFELNDVSFSLPKGYVMGFIGKNGAGKSTTLNCIMGIIKPGSGDIFIFDEKYSEENSLSIKSRIGFVSEEPYFYENFTVDWTGKFAGRFYKNWNPVEFDGYCRRFSLEKSKKIKELSRGMKTKLSTAIALSHKAELLILDEPSSGLDPEARNDLLDVFMEVIEKDECSILFSSHITSDIQKIADYVCIIDEGRIVVVEEKDSLLENYHFVQLDQQYKSKDIDKYLIGCREIKNGFSALTRDRDIVEKLIKKHNSDARVFIERPNLDELFLHLIGEKI